MTIYLVFKIIMLMYKRFVLCLRGYRTKGLPVLQTRTFHVICGPGTNRIADHLINLDKQVNDFLVTLSDPPSGREYTNVTVSPVSAVLTTGNGTTVLTRSLEYDDRPARRDGYDASDYLLMAP